MDESTARSRRPDAIRKAFLWALLPILVLFLIAPSVGDAQQVVTTNITPTQTAPLDLGTNVDTVGTTTEITGGTRPGSGTNLFHSFDAFTLGTGDTAHFLNDMQLPTNNIFGRVIGGEVSTIDGTLRTNNPLDAADPMNFGAATLWLVNPSGVFLGPNARIEVGGSVSMSTANYLRFEFDGMSALFDMLSTQASLGLLDVAPVVAFGFVGSNPGAITVQGGQFSVTDGQSLSLVGGPISIESGTPEGGTAQAVHLSAPNGKIQLASAASTGEFDAAILQPLPNVDGTSFTSFGSVSLAAGSHINMSGASTVSIRGGQLVLSVNDAVLTTSQTPGPPETISLSPGSSIVTSTSGAEPGADVQITVGTLNLDGSAITTETLGDGNAGHITANVGTLSLDNGATINSNNLSIGTDLDGDGMADVTGVGGNVTIQGRTGAGSAADSVTLNNGAVIKTETFGLGRGGDVSITADKMQMDNMSEVRTGTFFGGGVGGDIALNVGTLTLNGGSAIRTTDFTFGTDFDFDGVVDAESTGSGGHVTIQGAESAAESVVLSGGSQIVSESLDGNGGRLSIAATSMNLEGASTINSGTFGRGHGGDIEIRVQNASLSGGSTLASRTASDQPPGKGVGGTITVQRLEGQGIKADSLTLTGFRSGIITDSFGSALPGAIEVHAKTVNLTEGAVIEGGTRLSDATGGIVTINAESVGIVGGSHISSQARAQDAGQVTITADHLTLDNGSIETTTISDIGGRGGDVVLDVGTVSLTNGASINSQSEPFSTGRAGDITMNVGSLTLANQAEITSSSEGIVANAGDAGNVTITSSGAFTSNASTIATSAENARGGNIDVTAQSVALSNGAVMSASSRSPLLPDGEGNAGNITVRSGSTFVMTNSSMTTDASQASGGQIVITAPEMVRLIDSKISTSVAGSDVDTAGGNITIDPQFVILQNSQIRANAFAGSGGAIDITAGVFLADPASILSVSSTLGVSGTINIQSPLQNVGGRLTPLSQQFSSAAALLAQQCAARVADGKFSTFVVAGREGLPVEPGGFLASPSLTGELFGSGLSGRYPHTAIAAVTGSFPEYDARPIQLAKYGNACR